MTQRIAAPRSLTRFLPERFLHKEPGRFRPHHEKRRLLISLLLWAEFPIGVARIQKQLRRSYEKNLNMLFDRFCFTSECGTIAKPRRPTGLRRLWLP
jgi:hypothetical protein